MSATLLQFPCPHPHLPRAMASLNVHAGHDDYHAVDDTGFFQLMGKNAQEVCDLGLIAHKIAELALNPGLVAQDGPGNDWRCYVYWHLPGVSGATGQAVYQLDVNANGRYVADGDGPNEVNG